LQCVEQVPIVEKSILSSKCDYALSETYWQLSNLTNFTEWGFCSKYDITKFWKTSPHP